MKRSLAIIVALASLTGLSYAQQKTVTLTDAEATKIEAANLKLQNAQLQYQVMQSQLQKLQDQWPTLQRELNDSIEASRKAHQLGTDATLSQDGKSFTVVEKLAVPDKK